MKSKIFNKYKQSKTRDLINVDNSEKYYLPLYTNSDDFKKDYYNNLSEYLRIFPSESELKFINDNLYYGYNEFKIEPTDLKFTLVESKYNIAFDIELNKNNLKNVFRQAIKAFIIKCYKRNSSLLPSGLNWSDVITIVNKKESVRYEKIGTENLKIFLKGMMGNVAENLYVSGFSRMLLENYTYIHGRILEVDFPSFIKNEYLELYEISKFLLNKRKILQEDKTKTLINSKIKFSNPKKLALLQTIGFFDSPFIKNLSEDKQNQIVALLLDADKKEFVYKNRLNLNSKNPNYQIDKYTAFQYVEEMEQLLNGMQ
ncbi:hypothetical protein ACTJIV_15635 [Chryseobacterium sp. 22532]|uniref:hypothetical protein n=1 Tax=Chryseobacterium sp. 22532 TaxID=3453938 RepID=UPI003F87E2E7